MKELSIQEKATRYDEVINRMKHYVIDEYGCSRIKVADVFPELKESEDEKWIPKEIIKYLKEKGDFRSCWIAWLEKQCEHASFLSKIQVGDKVTRNEDGVLVNLSQLNRVANKQCEQKPTYKVESNFKVGDWVVYCNDDVDLITGIEENGYCVNNSGYIPFICESDIRLWTVQDVKDGDVLFTSSTASQETFIFKNIDEKGNAKCYFAYDSEDGFREGKYHFIGRVKKCKPATKEQRDLLFQKMHEAGYEWDAEKKELIKIEQKPAWSEEDEK